MAPQESIHRVMVAPKRDTWISLPGQAPVPGSTPVVPTVSSLETVGRSDKIPEQERDGGHASEDYSRGEGGVQRGPREHEVASHGGR